MKRPNTESTVNTAGLPRSTATGAMPTKDPWPSSSVANDDNDEMLAALGYKVRTSDMADVAQKLELLGMAMDSSSTAAPNDVDSPIHNVVHYNPSDLSAWLDTMLSELNDLKPTIPQQTAAPAHKPYAAQQNTLEAPLHRDPKRSRTAVTTTTCSSSSSSSSPSSSRGVAGSDVASPSPSARTMVLLDTQEAGIRLVHALMACAEAVQREHLKAADSLLAQISVLAASQGGAMRKVAGYFADALARRIYRVNRGDLGSGFDDLLYMHFFESCPYLKFAHFTANQAILDAFDGCRRVHVIDFGIKQGLQWPALIQALALRPGGPPSFRLTAIGPKGPDQTDSLQQVGWKLAQFAENLNVQFRYRSFVASSLTDIQSYMLGNDFCDDDDEPEVVAVNSIFELHPLLARQGAVEKVLSMVRAVRPKIVTVVEQEANHNAGSFVDRFTEALHYYSTMFDSLEGAPTAASPAASGDVSGGVPADQVMSEMYLGKQICNIVACEGADRTERHECLVQWRGRMNRAGFEPVLLGSNAFKQASMLLALFSGGVGYRVEEKDGCLTLGWHTRPLIATSAWRIAAGQMV